MEAGSAAESRYIKTNTAKYWTAIFVIFLGSMAAFGAEYCVQPLIPVIAKDFNLDPATGSLAVSAGLLGMAIAMLFIAGIGPRLDRKKVTAFALMVSAILTIVIGSSDNFYWILAFRFVQGVILAAFPSLMIAYINEEFEPSNIGSVLGIYIGGNAIGGLVGRLVVSAVTDWFNWRIGLLSIGVLYVVIGLVVLFFLPRPRFQRQTPKEGMHFWKIIGSILHNKRLLLVYAIAFCAMGSFVSVYNFITYVLLHEPYNLSQTVIGFLFFTYLVGTFSSAYMGRKTDSLGNGKVVGISVILAIIGLVVTLFTPLWCKILGLVIFTFGFFGCHTGACGWVGRLNKGDKASSSSLYMFFYYTGASTLGTAGGYFLLHYGWGGVVAMTGAAELLCLAFLAMIMGSLKIKPC